MPYIKQRDRKGLMFPETPGELNYLITQLIVHYLKDEELNYQRINDVVGALESAKMEFYRRIAVPYEKAKIAENGDVY